MFFCSLAFGGCMHATVLCFDYFDFLHFVLTVMLLVWSGVITGATVLAEENTPLFDYVHDNNFCLVVSLPVLFFGMLVIKYCLASQTLQRRALKNPATALAQYMAYTSCLVVRVHVYFTIPISYGCWLIKTNRILLSSFLAIFIITILLSLRLICSWK